MHARCKSMGLLLQKFTCSFIHSFIHSFNESCRRAADAMLECLIILLHFSFSALFRYKWLPQCKIGVDISLQLFVPMSRLQNLTLKTNSFKSPNSSKSEDCRSIGSIYLIFKVSNLLQYL